MRGTEGDYFGYWAFEAGAVAYLLDLDDSAITHMVYPKDLVAWARANKHLSEEASDDTERGRCEAGQPCPSEGFWFTPAQVGSRRFFKAGEVMPEVGGDYGATIWQWDQNQDPPGTMRPSPTSRWRCPCSPTCSRRCPCCWPSSPPA
jgi:hypothetical protein